MTADTLVLVVMLDDDIPKNLFFDPIDLRFELRHAVGLSTAFPPLPHCRRLVVWAEPSDPVPLQHRALEQGYQFDVVVCLCEIEDTDARIPSLVGRRLNHTMDCRLVESTGEELDGIPGIDDLLWIFISVHKVEWAGVPEHYRRA